MGFLQSIIRQSPGASDGRCAIGFGIARRGIVFPGDVLGEQSADRFQAGKASGVGNINRRGSRLVDSKDATGIRDRASFRDGRNLCCKAQTALNARFISTFNLTIQYDGVGIIGGRDSFCMRWNFLNESSAPEPRRHDKASQLSLVEVF
jgi:hypothetical protein